MLLSFTFSHYFFNEGEIFKSVPLAYPPLAYLFLRLSWIAILRPKQAAGDLTLAGATPACDAESLGADAGAAGRLHLNFRPLVMLIALLALIAFRIIINIADSNVVDVGYSGVIGANHIGNGETPYGHMPADNQNGDTYGPLNYLLYVPFEKIFPWSGSWDDLPAAHATAIFFDLVTIAGMFFAGRSLTCTQEAGNRLGLALAYGWAAFPYTTFVQNCNVNDSIPAALLVWGFVFLRRAPVAGFLLGLATQVKFFPALLGPLWASFPRALQGWGRRTLFVLAFTAALLVVMPVVFLGDGSFQVFLERSIKWQISRDSPFSIWGQYPQHLARVQHFGQYVLVGLAFASYFWPWRKNMTQVAAASAALLVGFQILQTHWFYLYIPWFFPLALMAFLVTSGRKRGRNIEAPVA
jgi:hypothetical protein